jgi:hypothetical protein
MDSRWDEVGVLAVVVDWRCGHCGKEVGSALGWRRIEPMYPGELLLATLAICPRCDLPTLLDGDGSVMFPKSPYGNAIADLPDDVGALYEEARRSLQADSPTAAAMAGRKLLMNVAVEKGAESGLQFAPYVNWLVENGYVTAGMKEWVDEIRQLGNDANHEIRLSTSEEAVELIGFVEMLLRLIYEFPERGRRSVDARKLRDAG